MADRDGADFDVIVVGGGPAGAVTASLLAEAGRRVLVLERDLHPRDHVGESLLPSTNLVFERIGFLDKIEDAGFVHKPGACWTSPRAPADRFLAIRLAEFPMPGARQPYTYNVERDVFDAMLLRHAHELGARVLQGVRAQEVLFEGSRAVGVRAQAAPAWERELRAPVVMDATGRSCLLGRHLGLRRPEPDFHQFGLYSWFRGVAPLPAGHEGMLFIHFLGLERAWAWQIPLRDGLWSVGVVTQRDDFRRSGTDPDDHFRSLVARSLSFRRAMRDAVRVRPWRLEGDYSYRMDRLAGPGWLLTGDALGFVDPIFSTGVDVACHSAEAAAAAIDEILSGADEDRALETYENRMRGGFEVWHDLTALFYEMQNLFTLLAVKRSHRENVVRILQGNPFVPEGLRRGREVIGLMRDMQRRVRPGSGNLLLPGALRPGGRSASPAP